MKLSKLLLVTTLLAGITGAVQAQSVNISRSDLPISGTNIATGLQNAPGVAYVANDGRTLLVIKNNAGTAVTGTLVTQKTGLFKDGYGNIALSNETITIPSASTVLVGPFPPARWNTNLAAVQVSLTQSTGISMTSLRLPQ